MLSAASNPHTEGLEDVECEHSSHVPLKEEKSMFHFTKKRAVVMTVAGSLALPVGAHAHFTSTDSGSGSATVGTSTEWTVATTARTRDPQTADGPTQTVAYTAPNPRYRSHP